MKFRALVLLCSASYLALATPREERLINAIRKSEVPFVEYHVARLGRDGISKESQRKLLVGLVPFADKVLKEEKNGDTLGSKEMHCVQIIIGAGSMCLGGVFCSELSVIYENWKKGKSQEFNHIRDAAGGTHLLLMGLALIYDGVRNLVTKGQNVLDAQEVKKTLSAHQEEFGL